MNKMMTAIKRNRLAAAVVLLFSLIYVAFELLSYHNFRFPMLDLGLYNRHMWGLAHFDIGANPLKGFNLLGDHSHFILLALVPFYALFQSPIFLIVVQALGISLSGIPIYLIAKKYLLSNTLAAFWLIPYYLYFGFAAALAYPFHVSTLSVLPLAWALYFLLTKKYRSLVISLALLAITKEDLPLVSAAIGIYLIAFSTKRLLGTIIIIISGVYFIFVTKYWLPQLSQISYYYSDAGALGSNWSEAIVNAFANPLLLLKSLFLPIAKTKTIAIMLGSFACLPLLAPEILFLLLPIWLGRFLNTQEWRWGLIEHYSANQGPILIVAAILGAYRLSTWLKNKVKTETTLKILISLAIIASISVNFRIKDNPWKAFFENGIYSRSQTENTAQKAIDMIPKNSSVGAQSAFPQLSSRKEIFHMPDTSLPKMPEYVLLSTSLDYWPFKQPQEVTNFAKLLTESYGYQYLIDRDGILLLRKTDTTQANQ